MQIIVITTTPDEGSREDYSLLYAGYLLVSSDTLVFNEPEFSDGKFTHDELAVALRGLGYTVEEPRTKVIEITS